MGTVASALDSEILVQVGKTSSQIPWLEIIKLVGAGIAFVLGLYQYVKAQRWKRVEFVAAEMKSFKENPATTGARIMLDWSVKTIPLYRFRGDDDEELVKVSYDVVSDALMVPPPGFDKRECAIREIFDEFLEFLERFEGFINVRVVGEEEFSPYLHYWTKLLSGNDKHAPEATETVLPALWKFIGYYGLDKVLKFVERYDKLERKLRAAYDTGKGLTLHPGESDDRADVP